MTVVEALRAAAQHVEEHKATLSLDGSEGDSARLVEVSALGHELDSLAAASETARVCSRECEAIRGDLTGARVLRGAGDHLGRRRCFRSRHCRAGADAAVPERKQIVTFYRPSVAVGRDAA